MRAACWLHVLMTTRDKNSGTAAEDARQGVRWAKTKTKTRTREVCLRVHTGFSSRRLPERVTATTTNNGRIESSLVMHWREELSSHTQDKRGIESARAGGLVGVENVSFKQSLSSQVQVLLVVAPPVLENKRS